MRNILIAFFLGQGFGSLLMWVHYMRSGLIRNREEYYKAKAEGHGSMK